MLHIILIAMAAIIVIFIIIEAMQPNEFRVTRSAGITAPPEKFSRKSTICTNGRLGRRGRKWIRRARILTKVRRREQAQSFRGLAIKKSAKGG
jgi:hypothetical protein